MFGGYVNGKCTNELWVFNTTTNKWKEIKFNDKNIPPPRSNHAAAMGPKNDGDVMIINGGITQSTDRLGDTWLFNLGSLTWEELKPATGEKCIIPSPRSEHSAIINGNRLIMFGGRGNAMKELNDLLLLNLQTMKWTVASELCLRPSPDKSFVLMPRESPSPGKSSVGKGGDASFTAFAAVEILAKQGSISPSKKAVASPGVKPVSPGVKPVSPGVKPVSPQGKLPSALHIDPQRSPSPGRLKRKKASPQKMKPNEIESALEELKVLTPTTSSMLHSVVMHAGERASEQYFQNTRRRKRVSGLFSISKQLEGGEDEYCVRGRIPCARSGHSAEIYKNYMIIFAGDRAQVALNDIYIFDLSKDQI